MIALLQYLVQYLGPTLIGIGVAFALCLRAVPPAAVKIGELADKIVAAFTRLVETHTSIYADLRRDLADCKRQHEEQGARLDALEEQHTRALDRARTAELRAVDAEMRAQTSDARAKSIAGERDGLAASIAAGEHHTGTHRGVPR